MGFFCPLATLAQLSNTNTPTTATTHPTGAKVPQIAYNRLKSQSLLYPFLLTLLNAKLHLLTGGNLPKIGSEQRYQRYQHTQHTEPANNPTSAKVP